MKTRSLSTLVLAALLALVAHSGACSEDNANTGGSNSTTACPQGCPGGKVCDPNLGQCVAPQQVTCPDLCPSGMTCDLATKTCVKAGQNQASCSGPCGVNGFCAPTNECACEPEYADCNGDIGNPGTNGCECKGSCDSEQCRGTVVTPGCEPNVVNDCGAATRYCEVDKCVDCPPGKFNCDGWQDCEADKQCGSNGCEIVGVNACPSQSEYCDETSKHCVACPAGTFNCGRTGGACDCDTSCDGTFCKKACTSDVGCNNAAKWCDFGKCAACPAGRENCNGSGACECQGTCNGTQCVGTTLCDYYDQNVCGGDQGQWCFENTCYECGASGGNSYNCNGTKGCECDSAGCNGTQCAGKCTGGECQP